MTVINVPVMIVQATDNPFRYKDAKKFSSITKFIGRGSKNSSTAKYAKALKSIANTHYYKSTDIVGVSVEGNRTGRKDLNYNELLLAVEAKAQIITDNISDRSRAYNVGERDVARFLEYHGYVEINGNGVWLPK